MPPAVATAAPDTALITFADTRDRQPEVSPLARAIAFIDSAVDDYPVLVAGVLPDVKVVVLSSDRDGIAQITETLQTLPGITNVYIVAHGAPGCLSLGNSELSLDTCDRYASQLRTWFDANDSQLLLYACNVAAGDAGAEFLTKLQGLVGGRSPLLLTKLVLSIKMPPGIWMHLSQKPIRQPQFPGCLPFLLRSLSSTDIF